MTVSDTPTFTEPLASLPPSISATDADDQLVIGAVAQGDSQALEVLYDRYSAVVYRLAFRMLKNRRTKRRNRPRSFLASLAP